MACSAGKKGTAGNFIWRMLPACGRMKATFMSSASPDGADPGCGRFRLFARFEQRGLALASEMITL